jgi:hypothetical protein
MTPSKDFEPTMILICSYVHPVFFDVLRISGRISIACLTRPALSNSCMLTYVDEC